MAYSIKTFNLNNMFAHHRNRKKVGARYDLFEFRSNLGENC